MKERIIFNVILLLSCLFTPWWFVALVMVIGMIIFEAYVEGIFGAVFTDILLGGSNWSIFFGINFLISIGAILFYIFAFYLRRRLFFVSDKGRF